MADLQIWYPIGTREEILAMQMPPKITASCSLQTSENRGCAHFSTCRFRQIRDRATPPGHKAALKGPENIAVYRQLSQGQGGEADIIFTTCENYYTSGLHQLWRHMSQREPGTPGEVIKVLGIAGEIDSKTGKERTYIRKEQVKSHVIKDPNCQACQKNECYLMSPKRGKDGKTLREPIPHFLRPNESLPNIAMGAEISDEIRAEVEREMEREQLSLRETADVIREDADERAAAKP